MASIFSLFPSKYLRASDVEAEPIRAVIEGVTEEEVGPGDFKPVLKLRGQKGVVLNKTRARAISDVLGQDFDDWNGAFIEVRCGQTIYMGQPTLCVEISIIDPAKH